MQANPHIVQIQGRWVATTSPGSEARNNAGILASFADREHAEAWLARYLEWRAELAA